MCDAIVVRVDRVEFVPGFPEIPFGLAVVILILTMRSRRSLSPRGLVVVRHANEFDPGVRVGDTLAETRAVGEV